MSHGEIAVLALLLLAAFLCLQANNENDDEGGPLP